MYPAWNQRPGKPTSSYLADQWVPAFAGMTGDALP